MSSSTETVIFFCAAPLRQDDDLTERIRAGEVSERLLDACQADVVSYHRLDVELAAGNRVQCVPRWRVRTD